MVPDFRISYNEACAELIASGFSKVETNNHPAGFCSDGVWEWWFRPLYEQAASVAVDKAGSWYVTTFSVNNSISCMFAECRQVTAGEGRV